MNEMELSQAMEQLLVQRNPRYMEVARDALQPGFYLRAAGYLRDISGTVIIATGFPVADSFETDGPVGAMALYKALQALGASPIIACDAPLSQALAEEYKVLELTARDIESARHEATTHLLKLEPQAIVTIERPGLTTDGCYYNMRGEDITSACALFDVFLHQATCPTIAIGDGGNEIGMGNIAGALTELDISTSVTGCDELLVADVSNWGAYGLIAWLAMWARRDLLADIPVLELLDFLSSRGSVDGVTGENTLTEDGLEIWEGLRVIEELRALTNFADRG